MGQIYKKIHEYVPQLGKVEGILVEIGSSRPGDDQSSQYLYDLANTLGIEFITCDINQDVIDTLTAQNIPAKCARGEDFINDITTPISIVYLDNFDWNWHPMSTEDWTLDQIKEYKDKYNIEMTNVMSQSTHLAQAILIEQRVTENSIICIDDTWFDRGWDIYNGKGGAAVPYLISKGYRVLYTEQYGTILGRFK